MSEVQSRPAAARGRSSGRGGRGGGYSTRGATRPSKPTAATNGDSKHDADSSLPTLEDEGEIGELKQKYGNKIGPIKELFSDWSDIDILYALQETDGDENLVVTRIVDGTISQWGEVSKQKKERSRVKAKNEGSGVSGTTDSGNPRSVRSGRNAQEGAGRTRGRAIDRAGRGGRGKTAPATTHGARNKETQPLSVPTEESSAWETSKPTDRATAWDDAKKSTSAADSGLTPATQTPPAAAKPDNTQKTWASMLRQSTATKPAPKPKESPAPKPAESSTTPVSVAGHTGTEPEPSAPQKPAEQHEPTPAETPAAAVPDVALPPPKDPLTESNLEHVADVSHPPATETARTEAADSWSPKPSAVPTPLSVSQQQQQAARTPISGHAATALKATERNTIRTPSFQRRVLDQEEAVRMPANRDQVERAAVQFGAFSLNGPVDEDIDGDREEPETRAQPPDDSPIAHPRASLPPTQPAPTSTPEAFSQKPVTTTLPPSGPAAAQAAVQNTQQFGRFGQIAPQEPSAFSSQKPFDTFGQQPSVAASAQSQFDTGFASQPQQAQVQPQQQPVSGPPGGAFTSAPSDFSNYYTADQQNRTPYNYYNQQFGQQQQQQQQQPQQTTQGQQEPLASQPQQRPFGGYNAPQADNLSQYPQSGIHHAQGRYGSGAGIDVQTSGNTTPNPVVSQAPQQAGQTAQAQSHGQQPHDFPYSHPYFASPYYAAYMNQFQGGYNQASYGGPYGKGSLYGQPHQYGMSPQGPYGHASSPAGAFGQSSLHRADSGVGAGIGDYGRVGSAQSGSQPGLGGAGFGGVHEAFGRGSSGYQSHTAGQPFSGPAAQQGNPPSAGDELKPFGDSSKAGAGPSPSLGTAARPGSAAANAPAQSGLPPQPSNQQGGLGMSGYGGYPSHLQGHGLHGNQSAAGGYGMSASGGQGHSSTPYGGYSGQGFGGSYYGNQPRGWGGNYH
ncbi:hypothetical protein VTK73DRAFT_1558 [Phialemonium thermophilum]|uniref:RNA polymerase II degradation factor 1 n=1 Tax=Phialemonium thermophilum TaxID=223376 RepID=A0ABR3X8P7_9PEZI